MIALDHVGFAVADYKRSKAFYEKALAPLGMTLLMEFSEAAAGFAVSEPAGRRIGRPQYCPGYERRGRSRAVRGGVKSAPLTPSAARRPPQAAAPSRFRPRPPCPRPGARGEGTPAPPARTAATPPTMSSRRLPPRRASLSTHCPPARHRRIRPGGLRMRDAIAAQPRWPLPLPVRRGAAPPGGPARARQHCANGGERVAGDPASPNQIPQSPFELFGVAVAGRAGNLAKGELTEKEGAATTEAFAPRCHHSNALRLVAARETSSFRRTRPSPGRTSSFAHHAVSSTPRIERAHPNTDS